MTDKDEPPDAGLDDFDKAAGLSFRDYPSTSLVMLAALSSGLGGCSTSGWAASGLVSPPVLMMANRPRA